MTAVLPLLIELGTEELPPKALDELALAFRDGVTAGFEKRGVAFEAGSVRAYWTPRRLALLIGAIEAQQPDQDTERRGPALAAGFDAQGKPSKALIGFAQSCGVDVAALVKLETDKGAWFVHRGIRRGVPTAKLVPEIVAEALKALPIPKPMRWGDHDYLFVRPAHWLVMLLGDKVIEGVVLGLTADRFSRGHRFHHAKPVWISTPEAYVEALRAAKVLVDPDERRRAVAETVERAADNDTGGRARLRDALLDEVKNLVEWPVGIACAFEREFLRVPPEALITTMESNQKFFPVFDREGKLTERFIGVANIESKDPAEVRKGYERVIRPRFADAAFFYDEDLKTPLASHQAALEQVTYQQKLGSVWQKCVRVAELARVVANRAGVDAGRATRAAALSKCDLMTRMVGEFPELQGTMGRYYATAQGEDREVAAALDEYYAPRFAGDAIAASPLGRVLAVADKLDTLVGLFAIGQKPSGSKDPFSLRRNALGLARTLIEGKLDLDLVALLRDAAALVDGAKAEAVAVELYDFVLERLRGYHADQGIRGDMFDAVASQRPASLLDFDARLRALLEFARLPEADALAAANKRIANILRQATEKGDKPAPNIDASALTAPEERTLAATLEFEGGKAMQALGRRDYVAALRALASLRPAIDAFFDQVMVMVEDEDMRQNRLALLADLRRRFLAIADIGLLQPPA
ncbi:MAG TPA: glycine--tRNA ligase subunit beta [Pseudomonadota bacterium]|nr:glycine--tRNA ligase subunit beta [Xanthomonadales bacterium]HQX23879.1 glycine--tRNA ligase subunit beta [Pseudomonadota bacterium]HQY35941.1 glycine--tRNA ligase subunit beta [Pseudomonadota bacterium]HRA36928.1 glycine--tRNA ligase subunit beta [Pseudomonadota bacterium]